MPRVAPDEQIFSAAITVMAERGYDGATTRRIAEAAGINEVTLFRRYGNKASLLRAAMLAELEQFGGEAGLPSSDDVAADLEAIVRGYQGLMSRRARLVPILLAELPRHPELAEVAEVPRRLLSAICDLVARHQAAGRLVAEPPFNGVAALLAPLLVPAMLGEHAPEGSRAKSFDPVAHVRRFLDGRRPT